jgi:hypothetical protein
MNDEIKIKQEIQFLLNSHHELIKAINKQNVAIMETNIILRGMIFYIKEFVEMEKNK